MVEKKKKKNILFYIFILFLIIYFSLYISIATGYYEVKNNNEMNITKEKMKEFENDINEGKNVNIDKYIKKDYTEYRNVVSDFGYGISSTVEFLVNRGIKYTFGFVSKLLT